ncbi:pimeloyl-ACP methyl ester carboxylesterase [Kribbella antiqua]|uniref:Pimeloyl-ACP methyl ester carboxylesterase n=1 Tax=Kribbella antiqua TaxID=2512217 RepID=A0A4R2IV67_9ACTN|nr:alpha/beta hydrolase [Kribbella antiqua]TCO49463.1 pimeloyl-ACP methyl ester carboxylesterase [Kribbella antiqua]
MARFAAPDGVELTYHLLGEGEPLVCVPGGMLASAYLGDLGGLSAHRQLVLLDLRGTGESDGPGDPQNWRCDRQVSDVEALREHLGLEKLTLLGHSAGASLVTRYAAEHPERIAKLVLATPGTRSVGIDVTADRRRQVLERRKDEPWYPEVSAAFEAIQTGEGADWQALNPMSYARWDADAKAHQAFEDTLANYEALGSFNSRDAFDPAATRAALTKLEAPALILAGALDWGTDTIAAEEFAGLFPNAQFTVLPGVAHHPWLDDPQGFLDTVLAFLR